MHRQASSSPVRRILAASLGALCLVLPAAPAGAAERPATPATLDQVVRAAQPGDTVLLADGDYGTFDGAMKAGPVTLRPQSGATARMSLDFAPASNLIFEGIEFDEIEIREAASRNITIRNSTITGQTVLRTGQLANANILFDGNHHGAWDKCDNCAEGRVWLPEKTAEPSGITIRNSRFGPGGNSDGIQNGSNGTVIENNEFVGIKQVDGADGVHADSIQLYGSRNTVIRGNWFHDVSVGIMCADGCDHELVEDNIFAVNGSPYAVTWLSDEGSVIRHNTFLDHGRCDYNQRCGILYLGNKDQDPPSSGTVLEDNILTRICVCDGSSNGLAVNRHNLFTQTRLDGPNNLRGTPVYVGGAEPASPAGFRLADGSVGRGDASDGLDRGVRLGADAPPAGPAPAPTPTPAPVTPAPPSGKQATGVRCATKRQGKRVRVACRLRGRKKVRRATVRLKRHGRVVARASGRVRRGRLPVLRLRPTRHRLVLVVRLHGPRGQTLRRTVRL